MFGKYCLFTVSLKLSFLLLNVLSVKPLDVTATKFCLLCRKPLNLDFEYIYSLLGYYNLDGVAFIVKEKSVCHNYL